MASQARSASFFLQTCCDEGEMLEWLKRHAWKACKLQKGFGGSNPPLSARLLQTIESELAQVRLRVKGLQGCRRQTWVFEVGERSEVGVLESILFGDLGITLK